MSLTYIASEDIIPGYGGGMSSAKAALESDTRRSAWEARRIGIGVNTISAGPLKSRAASAIRRGQEVLHRSRDRPRANSPRDEYAEPWSSAYRRSSPFKR